MKIMRDSSILGETQSISGYFFVVLIILLVLARYGQFSILIIFFKEELSPWNI